MARTINNEGDWLADRVPNMVNDLIAEINSDNSTGVDFPLTIPLGGDFIMERSYSPLNALSKFVGGKRANLIKDLGFKIQRGAHFLNDIILRAQSTILTANSDIIPTAFLFTDITGATVNTLYESDEITVAGIDDASPISIDAVGEYSIDGGDYTDAAGLISVGQKVKVRLTSSGSAATAVSTVLSIGTVSDTYTVTTAA